MRTIVIIFLLIFISVFGGCKTPAVVSETIEENKIEQSIFSARQDTVKIQTYSGEIKEPDNFIEEIITYYAVQIGAFANPVNAEQVYRKAHQRFNMQTHTDYDAKDELYKITIGNFINYEQARAFCDRIMREYPADYFDAWVIETTQRQRRILQ